MARCRFGWPSSDDFGHLCDLDADHHGPHICVCKAVYEQEKPNGVWVVYSHDVGVIVDTIWPTEIEAHQARQKLGYGDVVFWEFGKSWGETQG